MSEPMQSARLALRSILGSVGEQFARWSHVDQPATRAELEKQVQDASYVVEMMATPGWKVLSERLRANNETLRNEVFRLKPGLWKGPTGLEAKGRVLGQREAIDEVAQILHEGQRADKRLTQMDEETAKRPTLGRNGARPAHA